MDLVDLIVEKRFLGQEFLTWLWWKSEERGGSVELPGIGDITVVFEKHMLLESGSGEAREKLICQGLQTELREARTGLRMGKKLEKARMLLARGDYEWNLSLSATLFEYRNVRLPKTMSDSEESSDPVAVEGKILERLGMTEEAMRTIDELFRMYLKTRVSETWPEELARLKAWVHRSAGN